MIPGPNTVPVAILRLFDKILGASTNEPLAWTAWYKAAGTTRDTTRIAGRLGATLAWVKGARKVGKCLLSSTYCRWKAGRADTYKSYRYVSSSHSLRR